MKPLPKLIYSTGSSLAILLVKENNTVADGKLEIEAEIGISLTFRMRR